MRALNALGPPTQDPR